MSLEGLKGLIKKNYPPAFVVMHKDYEIKKYFDSFYKPMEELCSEYDIPLIKTSNISEIKSNFVGFDFGICSGFMEIIGKDVFDIPKNGIINVHCGKLPCYRGRAPISRTIMDGKDRLTISLHKIDEGVDSGDILLEKEIEIKIDDDVNSLYEKCSVLIPGILIEGVEKLYSESENKFAKQNLELKPYANKKITDAERKIDWTKSVVVIHNLIRAITFPYPCAYTDFSGKKYLFLKSEIFDRDKCNARQAGELYFRDDEYALINCIDGLLKVTEIRNENNEKINYEETFNIRGIFK